MARAYKNVERGEDTRRRVWAALRGFWERGEFPKVSELAEAAALPRPTVYRHIYRLSGMGLVRLFDDIFMVGFRVGLPRARRREHVDTGGDVCVRLTEPFIEWVSAHRAAVMLDRGEAYSLVFGVPRPDKALLLYVP